MYKINYFPFRTVSLLFMIYSNSDYSTFGKDAAFSCDDESIKQPFSGDTVNIKSLFFVQLFVIALVVYLSEKVYKTNQEPRTRTCCRLLLKYYYSGLLFVLAFTEVLKNCYTKLRPHFFYTCVPDMTNIDCSKGLITDFNCTGEETWLIKRDIYKSFPSGHASISMYAFIFVCLYLNAKKNECTLTSLNSWWSKIIPVLYALWVVTCCVSRVLDNRHFWWDVFSGALVGLFGGILTIHVALNKVKEKTRT